MWPEWLTPTLIIAAITLIFTALTAFFGPGFVLRLKANMKKTHDLQMAIEKQKRLVEASGDFFGGLLFCNDIKSFNKTLPIFEKTDNGESPLSIKKLPHNYLITGCAGDGKSTLVQRDFICSYKVSKKKCTLFFNVHNLAEAFKTGIKLYLDSIFNDIKFNEICLFVDGVDEIGENNLNNLCELITTIKTYCRIFSIKVSCRSDFANKYGLKSLLRQNCHNISDIEFKQWDKAILLEIADDVIDKTSRHGVIKNDKAEKIKKKVANDDNLGLIINNPLLLRLYLFIIINDENFDLNQISYEGTVKEYDLFNCFLDLFLVYVRKHSNFKENKFDISERAFEAYCKKTKVISRKFNEELPLFKEVMDNNVSFVHERFYEFFVAFYYKEMLIKLTNNRITAQDVIVLSREYSKAYAAFITDAIRLEKQEIRDSISDKLIYLYRYTLLPDIDTKYVRISRQSEKLDETLKQVILSKSANDILFIKDEIVFRLARLQTSLKQNKTILKVLDFIYKNDDYINNVSDDHKKYWTAIYKRSCAISSSLLGGIDIECNYVKHMLNFSPYNTSYEPEYDLVNRSHTLIYYGDERQSNLLEFRDQPGHEWNRAREARLVRLRRDPTPIISNDFSSLNNNQRKLLKSYRFRLFDLATLYCFLNTRKSEIKEHDEVYDVVKSCIVNFDVTSNIGKERCKMMNDIKDEIVRMFEA